MQTISPNPNLDSDPKLTDHEIRALKYVQQRKTPPSIKEVALSIKLSRQITHRVLTQLVRKRQLKSYLQFVMAKKPERRYVWIHAAIAAAIPPPKPRAKPRKNNFYNDPFNLVGVRDAN